MMSTLLKNFLFFVMVSVAMIVGGCGDAHAPSAGSEVKEGHFVDAYVEGLSYQTATQSGVTDAQGAFRYREGEWITFYLGDFVLGETKAAERLSVIDLIPGFLFPHTSLQVRRFVNLLQNGDKEGYIGEYTSRDIWRFLGLLEILQSFDADKNPQNGISIPTGIAALYDESNGDGLQSILNLNMIDPQKAIFKLRQTLYRAWREGYIASAAMMHPGKALDHLAHSLGITSEIYLPAKEEQDQNGDGKADSITTYIYDTERGIKRIENDYDGDGEPDRVYIAYYDENGRKIRWEEDSYGDGTIDQAYRYTYDRHGNRILAERITEEGEVEGVYRYFYDENGSKIREEEDNDADGRVDAVTTYRYDENGYLTLEEEDIDADGRAEWIERTRYFQEDNISRLIEEVDEDGDGDIDRVSTLTHDRNRRIVTMEEDEDGDGKIDEREIAYYDEHGNIIREEVDEKGDGTVDRTRWWSYDENGNITQIRWESEGEDGHSQSIERRFYDEKGNLVRIEADHNGDGEVDSVTTYTLQRSDFETLFNSAFWLVW